MHLCIYSAAGSHLDCLKRKVKSLGHVWLFATPRPGAHHAPPSMGFSRQEHWSGLPFASPGALPDPGMKPGVQADALLSEPPGLLSRPFWEWQDGGGIGDACVSGARGHELL